MERALKYALTAVAVGVEIANDKWGAPLRLKGWASEVSECLNSGELDDPLKRVADKYTAALSKTATCPEMQLAVGLLISMGSWHAAQHVVVEEKEEDEKFVIKFPPLDGTWEHLHPTDPLRLRPSLL